MSAAIPATSELTLATHELAQYARALFNEANPNLPLGHRADLEVVQQSVYQFGALVAAAGQPDSAALTAEDLGRPRHDLKNALNLILGFAHLLLRETHSPLTPLQYSTLLSVYQATKALLPIVDTLR